jgi:hypothetical protein
VEDVSAVFYIAVVYYSYSVYSKKEAAGKDYEVYGCGFAAYRLSRVMGNLL